jgi:hypothetical protein
MDVRQAAERIGTDEAQLRRFLRRVERGLGLRGESGSGEYERREFTDDQVENLRLAYYQAANERS